MGFQAMFIKIIDTKLGYKALCVIFYPLTIILRVFQPYKVIHITSPPDFLVFASLFPKLLGARVILDINDIKGRNFCPFSV